MTRVADLKYLAERWTRDGMGGDQVKVIVIRDKQLLQGHIPVPLK